MDIKMKAYHALPCSLSIFSINKIEADEEDFGIMSLESDGEYGCKDAHFNPHRDVLTHALVKYGITEAEYRAIQDKLEDVLYVGSCGWCV